VRQIEFARALGKILHRPAIVPAPAFALRLILGEFGQVSLFSQNARPKKLLESGFTFEFPDLDQALQDILPRLLSSNP
jgi:NAD dependent epimerase/dehydratase family enzyme